LKKTKNQGGKKRCRFQIVASKERGFQASDQWEEGKNEMTRKKKKKKSSSTRSVEKKGEFSQPCRVEGG